MHFSSNLRDRFIRAATGAGLALALAVLALASPTPALAEGRIRIAEQYGIVYLLLNVARDQELIEKHGKAEGLDISVEWAKLSGGSAVNDALLSGAVDIAGAGVGPLLTIWDRTRGKQNVKGVASLGNFPYYLVSNNPDVKTIADFTDKDRIAVPSVGVSVQSRVLQLASAKLWGDAQYNKLDKLSVALPHPDAAAAIIAGGTEITAHFGNPPFQAALQEAAAFAAAHPEQAADTYLRVTGAKLDRGFLIGVIKNPDVQFKLAPQNTYALAEFMHKVGAIKNAPASWQDYFFDDPLTAQGS